MINTLKYFNYWTHYTDKLGVQVFLQKKSSDVLEIITVIYLWVELIRCIYIVYNKKDDKLQN